MDSGILQEAQLISNMAWLFGFAGNISRVEIAELRDFHDIPLDGIVGQNHYIQAGGPRCCVHSGQLKDEQGRWIVVGIGLDPSQFRVLDGEDWMRFLSAQPLELNRIDGHFLAVIVSATGIRIHTDQLGLRTLYYGYWQSRIVFSTRLDWLARLRGGLEVDFEAVGSHWITFNPLSTRSQVHNLQRLKPGEHLDLEKNRSSYNISESKQFSPWCSEICESDGNGAEFERMVRGYCNVNGLGQVSLGLSGGLDSRLLLALGAHTPHLLGPAQHPDIRVAKAIAKGESIFLRHEDHPMTDLDRVLDQIHLRYQISPPVSPASSTPRMRFYRKLHQEGYAAIGGGFGEIARRHYLNRLALFGGWKGSPDKLLAHIRSARTNLFSEEVLASMMVGVLDDIENQRDALPANLDAENGVDLVCIRTRIPNIYGCQQAYLDSMGAYISVFVQPSVLRSVFQLPLSLRRNAKLIRQLIRANNSRLTKYPLVSETSVSPWFLPRKAAILLKRLRSKAGLIYRDPRPDEFLHTVEPFVLDLVHSSQIRTNSIYDYKRLHQVVLGYYGGDQSLASIIDWWLAFELWSSNLRNPSLIRSNKL